MTAAALPGMPYTPLSSGSPTVVVSGLPASPAPISASSSDANFSVSSLPHSSLLSALSSVFPTPSWYFPPAPAFVLCSGWLSNLPCRPVAIVYVASVISCHYPFVTLVFNRSSLLHLPAPYPFLCRLLGYCVCLRRPLLFLPRPQPPIFPVRTKMLAIKRAGVNHAFRLRSGPRHARSSLIGPLLWWGIA